jgi:hypothetical protein
MSFLQKFRKPESTVTLFFWTVLWVPFQAVLLNPLSLDALLRLVNEQKLFPSDLFSFNPQVFISYLFFPIIYCTIASMIFKPKRLVSPLNVQIGAFVLTGTEFFLSTRNSPLTSFTIMASMVVLTIVAAIAIPVGYIQRFIVRVLIGLDSDEENIQQITYSCNADFEILTEKVLDSVFLNRWKFTTLRDDDFIKLYKWTLKTSITASTNVILAVAPNSAEKEGEKFGGSVLVFVVYRKTLNYIMGSKDDLALVEDFCKIIRQKLFDIKVIYDLTEDKTIGLEVSKLAKLYAKQPTKSIFGIAKEPIIEVWHASHYHAYAIASFVGIIALLSVAFGLRLGNIDSNTYLNIIILVVLVFLAELGVSLREELTRRPRKSKMTLENHKS